MPFVYIGLAPVPVCGMILADYGAQVTRFDKYFESFVILKNLYYYKYGLSVSTSNISIKVAGILEICL